MESEVLRLVSKIQGQATEFAPNNYTARQSLLATARSFVRALETPAERITRLAYQDHFLFTTTRILIDLDVFVILTSAHEPQAVEELAKATGAHPKLLQRLLKHAATDDFVLETAPDTYQASALTRCLATPEGEGTIKHMFASLRVQEEMPKYLRDVKYRNPTDKAVTAWNYGMNTNQHRLEYISTPGREELLLAFHNHMRFKTLGKKWYEKAELVHAVLSSCKTGKDDVLLVDLGGSTGNDITEFRRAHGDLPGRLILQDLPTVIQAADSDSLASEGVETMAHDFFTPQPVHGARAYLVKTVLHDWPDIECRQILSNLIPAMTPGYSRILINELVIPELKAQWFETSTDMHMMSMYAAQERTESEWRALIMSVGRLKLSRIWDVEGAPEKVIEIELA